MSLSGYEPRAQQIKSNHSEDQRAREEAVFRSSSCLPRCSESLGSGLGSDPEDNCQTLEDLLMWVQLCSVEMDVEMNWTGRQLSASKRSIAFFFFFFFSSLSGSFHSSSFSIAPLAHPRPLLLSVSPCLAQAPSPYSTLSRAFSLVCCFGHQHRRQDFPPISSGTRLGPE